MSNYFDEYDILEKDMAKLVRDIVAERERQGISQGKLAEMAGIKQSAISRIENLSALPQIDTILKILHPLSLKLVVEKKNNVKEQNFMIKMSGVTILCVDAFSCRLKIDSSEDENFYFDSDEADEFVVEQEEHIATVKQKKHNNVLKNLFQLKQINALIKLPKSFSGCVVTINKNGATNISGIRFETLEVASDNGKIEVENCHGTALKAKSDNGAIKLSDITAATVEATNDNGEIVFSMITAREGIVAETDNGKISAENVTAKKIDCKTDNGTVVLDNARADNFNLLSKNGKIIADIDGSEEDFAMELATKFGSAAVGGKKHNGSYIYKDKEKTKYLSASSKNGKIIVTFADTDPKYKEQNKSNNDDFEFEEFMDFSDFAKIGEIVSDGLKKAQQGIQKVIKVKIDDIDDDDRNDE